jgi:hypothetical protein
MTGSEPWRTAQEAAGRWNQSKRALTSLSSPPGWHGHLRQQLSVLRSNKRLVNQSGMTKVVRQPLMPAAHGQPKTAVRATPRRLYSSQNDAQTGDIVTNPVR